MDKEVPIVQSVDRAIDILEALCNEKSGYTLTDLSKTVNLHKSTTYRLLMTLMERGYVDKNFETGQYLIGLNALHLAAGVLDRMDVRIIAKPYIQKLAEETNEVVHLAMLNRDEVVYIDKVESPKGSIRMYSQIGKSGPLHCTAMGKVFLSQLDDDEIRAIMSRNTMKKYTENTITSIEDLIKEINKVRKQGYAIDEIEHEEGIRCVGAPIYDIKGKIISSVSVTGPILFVTKERVPELVKQVKHTAKEISKQLGYKFNY